MAAERRADPGAGETRELEADDAPGRRVAPDANAVAEPDADEVARSWGVVQWKMWPVTVRGVP